MSAAANSFAAADRPSAAQLQAITAERDHFMAKHARAAAERDLMTTELEAKEGRVKKLLAQQRRCVKEMDAERGRWGTERDELKARNEQLEEILSKVHSTILPALAR